MLTTLGELLAPCYTKQGSRKKQKTNTRLATSSRKSIILFLFLYPSL
ncbi:hypothetical protein BMETH_3318_0 [methanotrophic bacterial endosymbiont of Bathymodiolus sp.]|nr:hypothetical protein BMETH_3318_0 [methanotrophic bacterial endosymbiont of Bathymodiolus sp.]